MHCKRTWVVETGTFVQFRERSTLNLVNSLPRLRWPIIISILLSLGAFVLYYNLTSDAISEPAVLLTETPVVIPTATSTPSGEKLFTYVEVRDGCDFAYVGECVNLRSGPGVKYSVIERLRNGVVLKVAETTVLQGETWYKIQFDKELRYPERVTRDWYVSGNFVHLISDVGDKDTNGKKFLTNKRIIVDISEETLYAYEGDILYMKELISTGIGFTPTPGGDFSVLRKTPSRYMQGPIVGVSDQFYDLPGVPWDLYIDRTGVVIHGAYWHDQFGKPWSHGCINLSPQNAKKLYLWADLGTKVLVID